MSGIFGKRNISANPTCHKVTRQRGRTGCNGSSSGRHGTHAQGSSGCDDAQGSTDCLLFRLSQVIPFVPPEYRTA
jgi:hypothetical protein